MSIVIQGISIPKRHYVEGYYIDEDGNVLDISRKRIIGKATKLPPHGRLIDADKLMTILKGISEAEVQIYGHGNWNFVEKCINEIENAPIVLQGEETE